MFNIPKFEIAVLSSMATLTFFSVVASLFNNAPQDAVVWGVFGGVLFANLLGFRIFANWYARNRRKPA